MKRSNFNRDNSICTNQLSLIFHSVYLLQLLQIHSNILSINSFKTFPPFNRIEILILFFVCTFRNVINFLLLTRVVENSAIISNARGVNFAAIIIAELLQKAVICSTNNWIIPLEQASMARHIFMNSFARRSSSPSSRSRNYY